MLQSSANDMSHINFLCNICCVKNVLQIVYHTSIFSVTAVFQWCVFFTYVYIRVLSTRQWTSLRVLSIPYVYVGRKNAGLEINPNICCVNNLPQMICHESVNFLCNICWVNNVPQTTYHASIFSATFALKIFYKWHVRRIHFLCNTLC